MDFMSATKTVLANYTNFNDRSGKGEFWWWCLAYLVAYIAAAFVGGIVGAAQLLTGLLGLAVLVPNIAVGVRRFHDIGKSGWWWLLAFIPVLGWVALIYFFIQDSEGPNQYGEGPLQPVA